jgi:hypothetical protein
MIDRRTFAKGVAAAALTAAAPAARSVTSQRRAEALALIRFAEQTHPRGLEARADPQWRKLGRDLVASASSPMDEYVVRALALLAWFHDGHTTLRVGLINSGPFALDMPIRVGVFYDGMYVVEAIPELERLLGNRIERVGDTSINDLVRGFASIWPSNNVAWPHHDAGQLFTTPGLLHGLAVISGAAKAAIPLVTRAAKGSIIESQLHPGGKMRRTPLPRTGSSCDGWAAEAGAPNFVRPLPDQRSLYVSLDDISQPVPQFIAFVRQVAEAMDDPRCSKLIIDLRRNPGGNNFLGEPLRKHIERSRFNRPGGLYVLVSPVTFSAAQNLSNRLERETFAIFAGEPTGGAPNHFGDAKPFPGLILRSAVSTRPWFDSYPMDRRPWIMPDMLIPRLFTDWMNGRDRVLDAVLADQSTALGDDLSEERTFYFARKSQSAEWKPFWLA